MPTVHPGPAPRSVAWRSGAATGAALLAGAVAAHVPLRVAVARLREAGGAAFADHLLGGLASDLTVALPALLPLWLALAGAVFAAGRRRPSFPRAAVVAAHASLGALLALLCLGGVAAAEFHIQRGLWPTLWDVGTSAGDAGFWRASAATLGMDRFRWPATLSLATIAAAAALAARPFRRPRARLAPLPFLLAASLVLAAGHGAARFVYMRSAKGLLPTVRDRDIELASPARHFARTAGLTKLGNAWVSAGAWLRAADLPEGDLAAGAALLGLPAPAGPPTAPSGGFRRPFPDREAGAPEVVARALALSHALFDGRPEPPRLLHVVLESVRAAEIAALEPAAPPGLTPFLNSLHDGSHGLPARTAAARLMFQGGHRTSPALGAAVCGVGHLPFGWSAARDFGRLPQRCLTDVLADAGFAQRFFVGGELGFDNMGLFFSSHGVNPVGEPDLPRDAPRAAWGVSDRGLVRAVLDRLAADAPGVPRWDLVLTLTNHGPYVPPADTPAEVRRRVAEALGPLRSTLAAEEVNRLTTVSYTDYALEELVRGRLAAADAPIVVVQADHCSGEPSPWRAGPWDPAVTFDREASRLPLVVLVPDTLVDRAGDPAAARLALGRLGEWLAGHALSASDVPTLELALLGASAPLRALPEEKRWHGMGGQATSPWFSPPVAERGRVWGIDAHSRLFVLDGKGRPLPVREPVLPVSSAAEIAASASPLRPAAAVVRRLLAGSAPGKAP